MKDLSPKRENDFYKFHRAVWSVVAGTGMLTLAFGYRDELVIGFTFISLLIGVFTHYRVRTGEVKKSLVPKTKVKKALAVTVAVLGLVIAGFASMDNVRLAVTVATIQSETEGYTTIQRCQKSGDDTVCLHEGKKDGIQLFHLNRGNLEEVKDITDTVDKYTVEKDKKEDIGSGRTGK